MPIVDDDWIQDEEEHDAKIEFPPHPMVHGEWIDDFGLICPTPPSKGAHGLRFFYSPKSSGRSIEPQLVIAAFKRGAAPLRGLAEVEEEIERASNAILSLEENWDGEGAPRFEEAAFQRAAELTRKLVTKTASEFAGPFIVPTLGPTVEGTIDVYWKTPAVTLLCNVPRDFSKPITFSGRRGTDTLTGRLAPDGHHIGHLAAWLARA